MKEPVTRSIASRFWRATLIFVLLAGAYATWIRFTRGLGSATHLSDDVPWGLWVGFDVLCGVGLAAGGFTLTAAVHIFHLERFKPVVRPAILTAFLGYLLVVFALFFDLGKPWNIWRPIVMWNPHSVMFEVAWCVMLYTTVLFLEFSPMIFEKLGWSRATRTVRTAAPILVIAGVILSTLHQSSLGSLFLIAPNRLHPLWYSPWLPVFFFLSSLAVGCAMVIFESFLSRRAKRHALELPVLIDLGRAALVVIVLYAELKLLDLGGRGVLSLALAPTEEGRLFLAEMLLGVLAPCLVLAVPRWRQHPRGLFLGAVLIILGFVLNRLNVSLTGFVASSGVRYVPSWMEIAVTASLVGAGFAIFTLAARHLPVFAEERSAEDLDTATGMRPRRRSSLSRPVRPAASALEGPSPELARPARSTS